MTVFDGKWKFGAIGIKNNFMLDESTIIKKQFSVCNDESNSSDINDFRRGGIIHKIVREMVRKMLVPGARYADIVAMAEKQILTLTKQDPKKFYSYGGYSGIAFPVGINVNNVVAHDTKISDNDNRELVLGDVVKIDIGVYINGNIIDSAFTHIVSQSNESDFSSPYNSVLDASKDAMYSAIALSGPDQVLSEISEIIAEIIKSYEVDLDKETLQIVPVNGIGGHNINKYKVHGGKLILSCPDAGLQIKQRMELGEIYAIETYATTGYGNITQNDAISNITHFIQGGNCTNKRLLKNDLSKWMVGRNGLPFSIDWAQKAGIQKLQKLLKLGIDNEQIVAYPPLYDVKNSVVAQFEHTIMVKDGSVEIFSLGHDF